MRAYFAPCGIGLGHASRCLAVARKLTDLGYEIIFSTYGEASRYVELNGFKVLPTSSIEYELKPDGSIDIGGTIAKGPRIFYNFSRQLGADLYYQTLLTPDVVISDSRITSSLAALIKRVPHVLITNQLLILLPAERKGKGIFENFILDFIMTVWKKADAILIPDFPPPYTISKGNLAFDDDFEEKVFLIGPIIMKLPHELPPREVIREELNIGEDLKLVLVLLSGTKREKEVTLTYLRSLLMEMRDLEDYLFVISEGKVGEEVKEVRITDNIISYTWLPNKFELLKASDIVIGHGGHTTIAEAMYYGVPMVLLPNKGHTERLSNARSMEELGLAKVIRGDMLNERRLRRALLEVSNEEYRRRAERISREIAIFNGAKKAAQIIDRVVKGMSIDARRS